MLRPAAPAGAQNVPGPVQGEITEQTTAAPLPGAVLRWLADAPAAADNLPTTTADAAGHFVLARPARAVGRLVVQALGYRPDTVAVAAAGSPSCGWACAPAWRWAK